MPVSTTADRPGWRGYTFLAALAAVVVVFGCLVVFRSTRADVRYTDFEVYARAAWAVRNDADVYAITDSHGWHYCYPPPFAVLMAPFAEPPPGDDSTGYLPFGVSVATWYAVSVLALFAGVHWLAAAIERTSGDPPPVGSRRWWALRVWPILLTLPPIGDSLSHGQVNLVVLFLLCAMIAAALRQRSARAGMWLAAAVAIKVIPGFVALVALRRRDARWVLAAGVAFAAIVLGIPALAYGPAGAVHVNIRFVETMIRPALVADAGADRADEMFHVLRTDNQSTQAVLHAWRHIGDANPPAEPDNISRAIHWLVGGLLTAVTLASTRGRQLHGNDLALFAGAVIAVMLVVSPMCHLHYYCLTLPLVMCLLQKFWEDRGEMSVSRPMLALFGLHVIGGAFPLLATSLRNFGFAPMTTLPLWVVAVRVLRRGDDSVPMTMPFRISHRRVAA